MAVRIPHIELREGVLDGGCNSNGDPGIECPVRQCDATYPCEYLHLSHLLGVAGLFGNFTI